MNLSQILGRVGKIETNTTPNGVKVSKLSMVTSKKFMKNGEKQEKSTWHNVTFFSKLAEIAEQYVAVGDLLYIQGEIDNQKYTDKNGIEKTSFTIIGNQLELIPKSKPQPSNPKQPQQSQNNGFVDDDIPW